MPTTKTGSKKRSARAATARCLSIVKGQVLSPSSVTLNPRACGSRMRSLHHPRAVEPLWSHQQKRERVHHPFSFHPGTAPVWIERQRGCEGPSKQEHPTAMDTEPGFRQDLVQRKKEAYQWSKASFPLLSEKKKYFRGVGYLTACQQKTMAGIALLSPPARSREQLPGELRWSSSCFVCKERGPPSPLFWSPIKDWAPALLTRVSRHLGFSLESLSQIFTQQRLSPLMPLLQIASLTKEKVPYRCGLWWW